ncbi:CopG family transcriptional regulator [Candidatus Bathyarchaeota archaeon]|nr:CopG family transcriptional regulator [Candidatus Bathyarchaeota archaeon]
MSRKRTVNISIALTREVLERLNKLSEETGMSRSAIIEQILRRHFKMGYLLSE